MNSVQTNPTTGRAIAEDGGRWLLMRRTCLDGWGNGHYTGAGVVDDLTLAVQWLNSDPEGDKINEDMEE